MFEAWRVAADDEAPLAVFGWSMGAYGALRLASRVDGPPVAAVAVASPALWHRFGDAAPGAFDDPRDFAGNAVFTDDALRRLRATLVRVDCGSDDPFEPVSRELLAELPDAEGGIRAGFHDAPFWRTVLPDQLRLSAQVGHDRSGT